MRAQSCVTLFNPVDCSPPGSAVHEALQARIVEWAATSSSRGSSLPRYWTHFSCGSCLGRWILYHCATWGALTSVCVSFRLNLWRFFCVSSPDLLLYWSLQAIITFSGIVTVSWHHVHTLRSVMLDVFTPQKSVSAPLRAPHSQLAAKHWLAHRCLCIPLLKYFVL